MKWCSLVQIVRPVSQVQKLGIKEPGKHPKDTNILKQVSKRCIVIVFLSKKSERDKITELLICDINENRIKNYLENVKDDASENFKQINILTGICHLV